MTSPGLSYDCPNCSADHQGFNFVTSYERPKIRPGEDAVEFIIFQCNRCHYPVVVEIRRTIGDHAATKALPLTAKYADDYYTVKSIRPKREGAAAAPEHTPNNVVSFYDQACRALSRNDADVAGMGFRKALDSATCHLIRTMGPDNMDAILKRVLKQRIDWLHGQGKLTADLKAWAHLMRDEGNNAAHEEAPYTPEEAKDLQRLTEVFLMYVFTLPGMIAERHPDLKKETQGAGDTPVEAVTPATAS